MSSDTEAILALSSCISCNLCEDVWKLQSQTCGNTDRSYCHQSSCSWALEYHWVASHGRLRQSFWAFILWHTGHWVRSVYAGKHNTFMGLHVHTYRLKVL